MAAVATETSTLEHRRTTGSSRMKRGYSARHYLTFVGEDLHRTYPSMEAWSNHVRSAVERVAKCATACKVLPGPSLSQIRLPAKRDRSDPSRIIPPAIDPRRISPVTFDEVPEEAWRVEINEQEHINATGLSAIGADLPIHVADYWNSGRIDGPDICDQRNSECTYGYNRRKKRTRDRSNVVIVDQGLNWDYIDYLGGHFVGGWHLAGASEPGEYPVGHGSMLARNILKVAPDAAIYDLPIIPDDIDDEQKFLSTVHAAFNQVLASIHHLQKVDTDEARWHRPWVFVNAWAVFNKGLEQPKGDYTRRLKHKFNQLITQMAPEFDMIFAAGNCGQFCPSRRCGADDVGPGHSIIGANSHPDVLTVGAVRADGMWLGYSSQGPGALSQDKPDLCAASQFREDDDAAAVNTGTSAACAMAAGVVAAFRSQYPNKVLPARSAQKNSDQHDDREAPRRSVGQSARPWHTQCRSCLESLARRLVTHSCGPDRSESGSRRESPTGRCRFRRCLGSVVTRATGERGWKAKLRRF